MSVRRPLGQLSQPLVQRSSQVDHIRAGDVRDGHSQGGPAIVAHLPERGLDVASLHDADIANSHQLLRGRGGTAARAELLHAGAANDQVLDVLRRFEFPGLLDAQSLRGQIDAAGEGGQITSFL